MTISSIKPHLKGLDCSILNLSSSNIDFYSLSHVLASPGYIIAADTLGEDRVDSKKVVIGFRDQHLLVGNKEIPTDISEIRSLLNKLLKGTDVASAIIKLTEPLTDKFLITCWLLNSLEAKKVTLFDYDDSKAGLFLSKQHKDIFQQICSRLNIKLSIITLKAGVSQLVEDPILTNLAEAYRLSKDICEHRLITLAPKGYKIFNGALIKYNGKNIVIARKSVNGWLLDSSLMLLELTDDFLITKEVDLQFPLDGAYEDPRVIIYQGRLFVSFTFVGEGAVQIGYAILGEDYIPEKFGLLPRLVQGWEKNWTFFEYQGRILFSYWPCPHIVCEFDLENNEIKVLYNNEESVHWPWGEIRGGTPPVLTDEGYVTFFHSCFDYNKDRIYSIGIIIFDSKPPFKIKKISKHPCIIGKPDCYKTSGWLITFPCGAVFDGTDWLLSYGLHDTYVAIQKLRHTVITADLYAFDNRKTAVLVVGPENSGDVLLTKYLVDGGFKGSFGHNQKFATELPTEDKSVIRISFPYGGEWKDLASLVEELQAQNFEVKLLITSKDKQKQLLSLTQGYKYPYVRALKLVKEAKNYILATALKFNLDYVLVDGDRVEDSDYVNSKLLEIGVVVNNP